MNYKADSNTTVTRDLTKYDHNTGNVYETLAAIAKRSNQISIEIKEELKGKLEEFNATNDNLEEIFENREQIEISKHYERMPKATLIAVQEYLEDKIYIRNPAKDNKDVI